jgi:hypothetical protein
MADHSIDVIVRPSQVRAGSSRVVNLDSGELAEQLKAFASGIRGMLQQLPAEPDGFAVEEIELHAEIDAKGKITLLGTGTEVGARGGIKLIFRRQDRLHA